MATTTVLASPVQTNDLTLARQACVNLIMLSLTARDAGHLTSVGTRAFFTVIDAVKREEFMTLHDEACARFWHALPPYGGCVPPTKPFSHHTHSVEIDESAEAHLARGNQALEMRQFKRAYDSYLAALEAADRA